MTPLTFLRRLTFNKLRAILEFMNCYAIELPLDEAQESFDHSMSQASLVYMLPPQTIAEESARQGCVHR